MTDRRKNTAVPPARPPTALTDATGQGVTKALRQTLENLVHSDWSRRMLGLEGREP